jgi:peptidoglycan/LPS O-acetylase OafA/YrhL
MSRLMPQSSQRKPELDGLRGLAILGVLLSHGVGLAGIFPYTSFSNRVFAYFTVPLWGGVDLFFVLSGFLITGILLGTKGSSHYFSFFYSRRVLRIFPIYYLTLTSSLIFASYSRFLSSNLPNGSITRLSYFLYLQNWPVFWNGAKMMSGPWGPYWSLAVEEQFYLIWPLIVLLFSEKTIIRACLLGIAVALPLRVLLEVHYFRGSFGLGQITTSRVDGLFAGAAIAAYIKVNKRPVPPALTAITGAAGLAALGYIGVFHPIEFLGTDKWMTTLGITAFALVSAALVAASQSQIPTINRVLTLRPLQIFGKYSYGIYVYHLFIFFLIRKYFVEPFHLSDHLEFSVRVLVLAFEIVFSLLIAKLSYDLFEVRFLRLKRHFEPTGVVKLPQRICEVGD